MLDLDDIQGDVLVGLQKDSEIFLFFKKRNIFVRLFNYAILCTILNFKQHTRNTPPLPHLLLQSNIN